MRQEKICRHGSLILVMVLLGSMSMVGAPSQAYGDPVSGKIIELQAADKEALAILGKGVVGNALPAKPISA